MATEILYPSENSLVVIVGTKLSRREAELLKKIAYTRQDGVSGLVREILRAWMADLPT